MAESFVDVSYRGLELGRRLKLRDVAPRAGYLEIPLPMPVGSRIAIATDDGVTIEAVVTAVHEQVGGSDQPPGMRVAPELAGAAAAWWSERIDADAAAREREEEAARAAAAAATPSPARAPDHVVADDGRQTLVMPVVEVPSGELNKTTVMDAIDISMITGEPLPEVGAAGAAEEAEITIEPDDSSGDTEVSGEISTEMPVTPSGGTPAKKKRSRRKKR